MNDTIAAIATGPSTAGISIIRISGPKAIEIANSLFSKDLMEKPSFTIHYGFLKDGDVLLDEVLVSVFRGPKSYTGEDVAEINCHGGILVTRRILESVLFHGARLSEPGEFTKRAFLNGRLDLAEAESVMDLISAKSEFARKSSLKQLTGALSERIRSIKDRLLEKNAYIEAALDDPEHFSLDGFSDELRTEVDKAIIETEKLLSTFDRSRLASEGIRTVLAGRPNVGKSSLLNLLLNKERAIVTEIPGTTRDTVEETVELDGLLLRLVDTAGIRSTSDPVEKIGVERAKKEWEEADLLLLVLDGSQPLTEEDRSLLSSSSDKKRAILLNKTDLPKEAELSEDYLSFSAKTGEGTDLLIQKIREMFYGGELSLNEELVLTNLRHKELLLQAKEALLKVIESMENGMPEDFYTIDLSRANACFGEILGEEVREDLVNEIFSKFCMGK
jgi:tRNA modification GTPase